MCILIIRASRPPEYAVVVLVALEIFPTRPRGMRMREEAFSVRRSRRPADPTRARPETVPAA
jgi:hypothetical protein